MKHLIYILIALSIFSCDNFHAEPKLLEAENLSQNQIDSILTDYPFQYSNPVFVDSGKFVLLPITTDRPDSKKSFGRSYKYYPRYWNIVFYNASTNQTRLLTESKFDIDYFQVNIEKTGPILSKSILYEISDQDYNNNQKLDNDDPKHLFISKTDGSQLKRLSPLYEDLISYKLIPFKDQIILETRRDINKDSIFDVKDDVIWYKINLEDGYQITEMMDSTSRRTIQNLYFNQWLKKK